MMALYTERVQTIITKRQYELLTQLARQEVIYYYTNNHMDILTFSQHSLQTFLVCQRRFQLRYLVGLPWPSIPLGDTQEDAAEHGRQFHQVLERHFLGLNITNDTIPDDTVRGWWSVFQSSHLPFPPGKRHPERELTVPIGRHLLTGRFDLLITGRDEANGEPFAHLVDWKTGQPPTDEQLRRSWQTRLYLALLAEGGHVLLDREQQARLDPDRLAMTYWYVAERDGPRTIHYSRVQHQQNWAELTALVAQIEELMAQGTTLDTTWPLADDWSVCRACSYQAFNGRQEAGPPLPAVADEDDETEVLDDTHLEPASP
jgi:hypothetical protein